MKNKKLLRVFAAALTGIMLLGEPLTAAASRSYHPQVDAGVQAVAGFSLQVRGGSHYVKWQNQLRGDMRMYVEWSTRPDFPDNDFTDYSSTSDGNEMYLYGLEAGKTYYIRAYIRDEIDTEYNWRDLYGPYSSTITYQAKVPDVRIGDKIVGSTSLSLRMVNDESVTGYEIYRATGSGSYKKVAKISDFVFKDSGLKASQLYRYKIRAYVYNRENKKTSYGKWTCFSATTWGRDMELRATPVSSKSIKLTWKKVSGASGYEIYRSVGSGSDSTVEGGSSRSFTSFKLIKTIKKSSATSYTDKKLTPGESYTYKIVAYKNVKSKKKTVRSLTISDTDSATLDFGIFYTTTVNNKDGSVTLRWKKMMGADGFLVEKKDANSEIWTQVTKLKSTAVSYTFPKSAVGEQSYYRICAYNGDNYSYYHQVTTTNYSVSKPGRVKVSAAAGNTGVNVSWGAVPGAAYYKVYRSRVLSPYNKDLDSYTGMGETVRIPEGTAGGSTNEIKTTSVTDTRREYKWGSNANDYYIINEGPQQGVRYYYYVQAYKSNGQKIDAGGNKYESYSSSLIGRPASITLNNSLKKPSISVKSKKKGQITVSWKKVDGATRYYIYRSTKSKRGYTLVGSTNKTSYISKKLKSKKKYYFKVKAYRPNVVGADLYSGLSGAKSAKAK